MQFVAIVKGPAPLSRMAAIFDMFDMPPWGKLEGEGRAAVAYT